MRRLPLALTLIATSALAAPRVSPRVRMVARGQLRAGAIAAPDAVDDRASVTVRVDGGADALGSAGFDARRLTAHLAEVRAGSDELARLIALPGVQAVEERRLLHPLLDQSGPAIHAPQARQATGLDGTGVLVGFVDTGADVRHADLRHQDGTSRVAVVVDFSQMDDGRHPELGKAPGRVWTKSDIDAALAAEAAGMSPLIPFTEQDLDGHGTHVAATATSNGLATGNGLPAGRYVGIAPGADLVVAQTTHGGHTFSDADVAAAMQWVADMGDHFARPLVLNLSLGGSGGPHDGTSALEVALDELFPPNLPGRVAVVAVGNDGGSDLHAGASLIESELVFPLQLGNYSDHDGVVELELWYTGSLELMVESPGGFQSEWVGPGGHVSSDQIVSNHVAEGQIIIDNSGMPEATGRRNAGVALAGPMGASPVSGAWKLHVRGQADRFDAWSVESPPSGAPARFTDRIDEDERVGLPATAHNAIIVGSFATRNGWKTNDGQVIQRSVIIGNASAFSSTGPTSDGRFVPDVLAPGEFIIAALSSNAPPNDPSTAFFVPGHPNYTWADDGVHAVLRGTSQAAPHVSGALALLLQADPTLDATALREILRVTAAPTPVGWSPREGFGKLDVLAALELLKGKRGASVDAGTSSVGTSRDLVAPGSDTFTVSVIPRDAAGTPVGPGRAVTIVASEGAPAGDVVDAGWGRYERTFVASAPRGTFATVTATVDGVTLTAAPVVWFAADRSEIGHPFAAGGGCALGGPGSRVGVLLLLVAVALLARNSRRRRARSTLSP
jgi:subtilisin family serine protease